MDQAFTCSHQKNSAEIFCIKCQIERINICFRDPIHFLNECERLYKLNDQNGALICLETGIQLNLSLYDSSNEIGDALKKLNKDSEAYHYYKKGLEIKKQNIELLKKKNFILQQQGRYNEGLACLQEIEKLSKIDQSKLKGIPKFIRASLLHQLQNYDEALDLYDQFLQENQENVKDKELVLYQKGFEYLNFEGKYYEALQCYHASLKINPEQPLVLTSIGSTLSKYENDQKALIFLEFALRIDPQLSIALQNKGNVLYRLQNYGEALKFTNEALKYDPKNYQTLNNRGTILQRLKQYEESVASYEAALTIKPLYHLALHGKGNSLVKLGRFDYAIECFNDVIKINPQFIPSYNSKGIILNILKRYDEEQDCYEMALKINPNHHFTLNNYGMLLSKQGKYNEALKHYDNAIRVQPQFIEAFINKGNLLIQTQQYKEALLLFNEALNLNSSKDQIDNKQQQLALVGKSNALTLLQRFDEAMICVDTALNINDMNVISLVEKGKLLCIYKKYDEAQVFFDAALIIDSQNGNALYGKGLILQAYKIYEEALIYYDKALKINPSHLLAHEMKINILCILRRYEDALKCTEQALKKFPGAIQLHNNKGFFFLNVDILTRIRYFIQQIQSFNQEELLNQGKSLLLIQEYSYALICFEKLITENHSSEIYFYKSKTLFYLQNYEEALHDCDIAKFFGMDKEEIDELREKIIQKLPNKK